MNSNVKSEIPSTLEKHREFHELANDADWAGDFHTANLFRRIADTYLKRHLSGDIYDPPF